MQPEILYNLHVLGEKMCFQGKVAAIYFLHTIPAIDHAVQSQQLSNLYKRWDRVRIGLPCLLTIEHAIQCLVEGIHGRLQWIVACVGGVVGTVPTRSMLDLSGIGLLCTQAVHNLGLNQTRWLLLPPVPSALSADCRQSALGVPVTKSKT